MKFLAQFCCYLKPYGGGIWEKGEGQVPRVGFPPEAPRMKFCLFIIKSNNNECIQLLIFNNYWEYRKIIISKSSDTAFHTSDVKLYKNR